MTRKRKSPILTPSKIPCLSKLPTINITRGCALGCRYCYIQGYANYPGSGKVVLYENTAELLAAELRRRRKKPRRVFFSPSSDAFQYPPEVQKVSLEAMAVLLCAGVEVAFLTKGFITEPFLRLFSRTPELVFAQIGITTLDQPLCKKMEPRAAVPRQRLSAIEALHALGISVTARLDPLIPDLTDTDENLIPLLAGLRRAGASRAAASYLFHRPGLRRQVATMLDRLQPVGQRQAVEMCPEQEFADQRSAGRMIDLQQRRRRFDRIQALCGAAGIRLSICRCKNPTLGSSKCEISGPTVAEPCWPAAQRLLDFGDAAIGQHLQRSRAGEH
ncbi:MAG: radical SAM protein [bacterium]|nr:radical SAM protein [bacterium]